MTPFKPRLDTLPTAQRTLWSELTMIPEEFILYGGTAIALQLGHRQSVDFDFFGADNFDPEILARRVPLLQGATVTHREANSLTVQIDRDGPVKVSFFGLPEFRRLRPPLRAEGNGLKVASMLDLAGTKASVVQRRAEAKDYIDIDAIISMGNIDLLTSLAAALAIHGGNFNPQITLKALSWFGDGNLRSLSPEVQNRLAAAARAVDLNQLPKIAVEEGP